VNPPLPPAPFDEAAFLRSWNQDIQRAARAAANGNGSQEEDLGQQARERLLLASRAVPNAPRPYIRVVIANTLRSARRREGRSFSTRSPLAQDLDDDLVAPKDEPADGRAAVVASWAARLPVRLCEVYRHLYVEERSQRETAQLMRVSQPRVAQLHQQLLKRGRGDLAYLAA